MKVKTHFVGITAACAALTAALALSASAADTGLYFDASAGPNFTDADELDVGFRFSAGVGYNLNKYWGVEFDTGWAWNKFDSGGDSSYSQLPFMVNVVYRYPIGAKFETYIGGGVGGVYAILDIDDNFTNDDDGDVLFGWQAIAGVRYIISETMSVGIGYKYLGTSEGEFEIAGGKATTEVLNNHTFGAVFNWKF
jgi:opacity protein-like surface antigen